MSSDIPTSLTILDNQTKFKEDSFCNAYLIEPVREMNFPFTATMKMLYEDLLNRKVMNYGQAYPLADSINRQVHILLPCRTNGKGELVRSYFNSCMENLLNTVSNLGIEICYFGFLPGEYDLYEKDLKNVFLFSDFVFTNFYCLKEIDYEPF